MKFNININQKAFSEISDDLDLVDCAIVDLIKGMYFWNNAKRKRIKGKDYIWVSYQMVIDQMPLLKIKNKETLARRFKKLEKAGAVEKKVVNKNMTFFRITDKVGSTIFEGGSTQKSKGLDSKVGGGSTQKSTYYNKENNNKENKGLKEKWEKLKDNDSFKDKIKEAKKNKSKSDAAKLMEQGLKKSKSAKTTSKTATK